jgi:hypothetical protein
MNKNLFVGLFLLLAVNNTHALHWTKVYQDKETTWEAAAYNAEILEDPVEKIQVIRVWLKNTTHKTKNYNSHLWHIDCANKKFSLKHLAKHNAKGKSLGSATQDQADFEYLTPDSVGWYACSRICEYVHVREYLAEYIRKNKTDPSFFSPKTVESMIKQKQEEDIKESLKQSAKEMGLDIKF